MMIQKISLTNIVPWILWVRRYNIEYIRYRNDTNMIILIIIRILILINKIIKNNMMMYNAPFRKIRTLYFGKF